LRGEDVEQMLRISNPAPNPFSQTTQLDYTLSTDGANPVRIGIYDVAGRLVRELVNQTRMPGDYRVEWDGRDADGLQVTKGVYFVRAQLGSVRLPNAARILYLR
jgi:flagellar hook assembly protein FlgD